MQAGDAGPHVAGEPACPQPGAHACTSVRLQPVAVQSTPLHCIPYIQVSFTTSYSEQNLLRYRKEKNLAYF